MSFTARRDRRTVTIAGIALAVAGTAALAIATQPFPSTSQQALARPHVAETLSPALSSAVSRQTALLARPDPRGIGSLAGRISGLPRAVTTGNNPRGTAIVTAGEPVTVADAEIYQEILSRSGPSGLAYALETGRYPASGVRKR